MELYDNRERWHESGIVKDIPTNSTKVQQYYSGKTVLITGATGFLGTLLIEKLLRACNNLKKLILVIRDKEGKYAKQRAAELVSEQVFFLLKESNPKFWRKIRIIRGDWEEDNFGIDPNDINFIRQEVDIIFHLAGTTRYDDPIRKAYTGNVNSTKYMLKLAKQIPNLKAFVYTSTVYSYTKLNYIEEKFYQLPYTDEQLFKILEKYDDATLACFIPKLLNDKYNTFTLTKGVAENVLSTYINDIPAAICRMSSVSPTIEQPSRCYTKNTYGATDIFTILKSGFLKILHCDRECKLEIIPADKVANTLIAIPLHLQNRRQQSKEFSSIYNCVAKPKKCINWEDGITKLEETDGKQQWKICCRGQHLLTKCPAHWYIRSLIQVLPLIILSLIGNISQERSNILSEYIRWYWNRSNFSLLTRERLNITIDNVKDLIDEETAEDKVIFDCDNEINWNNYFFHLAKFCTAYVDKFDIRPIKNKKTDNTMEYYEERDSVFDTNLVKILPQTKSEIQRFYSNKTILITGGSGFLGVLLIEKLLRSCVDVKKLILILREKKGKTPEQRLHQLLDDVVFTKMKSANPQYLEKIEVIEGDCMKPYYGIQRSEWRRLQQEIEIIFHAAANIAFMDEIRMTYNINVAGTKYLLQLCKGMPFLKAFIYVSTAFSQLQLHTIEEKFYEPAYTDEQLLQLLNNLDDATLACLNPLMLNGGINNYVLTKGVAEDLIKKQVGKLPVSIYRPSIMTATYEEPLTNWANNISGATGIFAGTGLGFIRSLHCDPDSKAEIIPADRTINCLIAIPNHMERQRLRTKKTTQKDFVPIYNYVVDPDTAITWGRVMYLLKYMADILNLYNDIILWKHHLSLDKYYYVAILKFYFLHLLPAPIFVIMEKIQNRKPRIWNAYIKFYNHLNLMSIFTHKTWIFEWQNVKDLMDNLSYEDKILFNCDNDIDWKSYMLFMSKGISTYIMGVEWNTTKTNSIKKYIITVIDATLIYGFKAMVLWFIWKLLTRTLEYISLI